MKKGVLLFFIVLALGFVAGNSYGLRLQPAPPLMLPIPPPLVVIPGTYVYAAPIVEEGLFFFDGYWYRQQKDRWYRAARYDARSWNKMRDRDVPMDMRLIPSDYRMRIEGRERLRYADVTRNWRTWKNSGKWEHDPG